MRKLSCMILAVMLLLTMTAPALADDTVIMQEGDEPHTHSWGEILDTATCTEAGTITRKCSCGETEEETSPAKGHSYGAATKVDDQSHKSVCSRCKVEMTAAHTWNSGTETTAANCQQSGIMTYTCTGCGATKTESIPMKTTHNYGAWTTTDTLHSRECSDCHVTDSGNHSWKEEIVKKPTCKEEGSKKASCTVCGYTVTTVLQKLTTHTYDSACDAECNVCGKEREVEHTFTTTWSKNYSGHWHECTKCGEQKDFSKHIPGPAATEESDQVCVTCGYIVTAKKEHVHSYETEWTSDEAGHWHACTGKKCSMEKDYAAHTFDDECDSDCNVCGYKRENAHTYDETWQTTKWEHWQVCTVCGEESEHEKHIAGPEATDEAAQICTVCEFELAPMLEHTHDFGSEWIQTQDSHWQECKCGELSIPEPHTWDKGVKNRDKTITYTCTVCGAEKTEKASSGFSWLTVILVLLALVCVGGIVVLVIILKRGGFGEEEDLEGEVEEEPESEGKAEQEEDREEKMIDDYFSALDEDGYK